jgi:SprT protein
MFESAPRGGYPEIEYARLTALSEVEPISESQQAEVRAEGQRFIGLAEDVFGRVFDRIPIQFDLRGRAAGMFKVDGDRRWVRFNPWIFAKYYRENLAETVPHEIAHYIVHEVWGPGTRRRRVKPHGEEWRAVMAAFGVQGEVTFDLDLEGIPQRRQSTHPYRCDCRIHQISTTRHNRVMRGVGRYQCRKCDAELVYLGTY